MLIFFAILVVCIILVVVLLPRKELKEDFIPQQEYIPFLWEDAYNQKEILPIANKPHILNEFREIEAFAKEHNTGMGYNGIYVRTEKPTTIQSLGISVDAFSSIFDEYGFKRAGWINYWGNIIATGSTLAFGKSVFTVFAEQENGYIKAICVFLFGIIGKEQDKKSIAEALHFLGTQYNLTLTDWDTLTFFNLSEPADIEAFLSEYCP
ncbi:hypothetical protein AM493_15425 [Flavobacterium akiainvivens]|uniref:Uncharacterized protein n=1 Tax=Flavobacterium akiainvivens TaxID=1202724 RepID=A0A0N0RQX7_9FLAO|nr:hypothetical protein [Flavobacterium akiainvivens]KOS07272.1 hypothetical protein AM493_15425 [Flavobacterium akiainvivens]SFQ46010.1 hypothetical protein SAMN05444144_10567 [Flavobacterium akiainvivens]